jgi:hypothetical protein
VLQLILVLRLVKNLAQGLIRTHQEFKPGLKDSTGESIPRTEGVGCNSGKYATKHGPRAIKVKGKKAPIRHKKKAELPRHIPIPP